MKKWVLAYQDSNDNWQLEEFADDEREVSDEGSVVKRMKELRGHVKNLRLLREVA